MPPITVCKIFDKDRPRPVNVCMECEWSIGKGLCVLSIKTADGKRAKVSAAEYQELHAMAWHQAFQGVNEPAGEGLNWVTGADAQLDREWVEYLTT